MPRRQEHVAFSLLLPLGIIFFSKISNQYPLQFLIVSFLCIAGSMAPDIIEPARVYPYYTHRSFFHSWKLLSILSIIFISLGLVWYFLFRTNYLLYASSFLFGYISHLLLDATTQMGLPSK